MSTLTHLRSETVHAHRVADEGQAIEIAHRLAERFRATAAERDRVGETFKHPAWPCTLDVHASFPGFLTEPEGAFDALWERRTEHQIAGAKITTCDLLGHAVVLTAHAARMPWHGGLRQELADIEDRLTVRLSKDDRRQLAELATATGTVDSLGSTWRRLDIAVTGGTDPVALAEWHRLIVTNQIHESQWLAEFANVSWRERLSLLRRAIWLSDDELVVVWHAAPTRLGIARARLRRLWTGLRGLPSAYAIWRRAPRGTS